MDDSVAVSRRALTRRRWVSGWHGGGCMGRVIPLSSPLAKDAADVPSQFSSCVLSKYPAPSAMVARNTKDIEYAIHGGALRACVERVFARGEHRSSAFKHEQREGHGGSSSPLVQFLVLQCHQKPAWCEHGNMATRQR